ncbi:MAG: hypothetical protein Q9214_002057 [Letrouitia sp. 1 TL-2023]
MAEIQRDRYAILSSPAAPVPLELRPYIFKASVLITWSLYLVYSVYELALTYLLQRSMSQRVLWRTWITVFAEFCLSFQEAVLGFNILFALFTAEEGGEHPRPSLWLKGQKAPRVDVLITCCGEGVDVLANTILAAASQDYPEGRLRVFVLDDRASEELRSAVETIDKKKGTAQVKYLSRTVKEGQKSLFKAGNLRFGIEESKRGGGAEFVAGLDADMIPESGWLRKMVPHLEVDESVGIACPPQVNIYFLYIPRLPLARSPESTHYYNVPPSDPLGQSADFEMFFSVQEILNDRLGAAMCTGSGYVARRSALEAIGGWPLAESGEDYMCSTLLGNEGWKIVFVRERLQLGMAPGSLKAMVRQRMRWTDAGVEVHKQFGYYLPFFKNKVTLRMTAGQRAANGLYMLRDYAPLANVLALGALPCCLMLPYPSPPTATVSIANVRTLYALYVCSFLAHKLNTIICFGHVGLSRVYNFQAQEIWAAPCSYFSLPTFLSSFPPQQDGK